MLSIKRKFTFGAVYAIAMALVEAAVVVYLRLLYYPEGFADLIKPIPSDVLLVEVSREAATIVMLFAVAAAMARKTTTVFAWFVYLFGIWDIFYYVWLKVFLNWPQSLLDWDLLFLIPIPWLAPVLAPVIVSLLFITGAAIVIYADQKGAVVAFRCKSFTLLVVGALVIILSFTINSSLDLAQSFPESYPWGIYFLGIVIGAVGFASGLGWHIRK